MKEIKITRKTIERALKVMVATAPTFVTFINYFFDYTKKLKEVNSNYVVTWDDSNVFEIYNSRSKKSTFFDYSKELYYMD